MSLLANSIRYSYCVLYFSAIFTFYLMSIILIAFNLLTRAKVSTVEEQDFVEMHFAVKFKEKM